jgi:hypothetical protein
VTGTAYANSNFTNEPPHVLIKQPLKAGLAWKSFSRNPEGGSSDHFEVVVEGRERIEVPAGSFDAWKLEYTWLAHLGTTSDWMAWYVPGKGFVQFKEVRGSTLGKKHDLEKPRTLRLARIERTGAAHPIDYPSASRPVAELPAHIKAPAGKVSLHADYGDIWQKKIVVYLVNRTHKLLRLPAEDDDIYLKLETRNHDGRWVRAQTHRYSWCGNSYHHFDVPAGQFRALLGFKPASGQERQVRYRVYWRKAFGKALGLGPDDEIVSNPGNLPVDADIVTLARYDSMALRFADLDTIEAFLFEDVGIPEKDRKLDEDRALDRLAEFKEPRAVKMVERFLADDSLDERSFQQGIACLGKIAPERLAERASRLLREGPEDRRRWMVKRLTSLDDKHSKEIDALLIEQARDPKTRDLDGILQFMASRQVPAARQLLIDIKGDERYPETVRAKAGWLLAWTYAEKPIELEFEFIDYDNQRGMHPPGRIKVSIENKTRVPLTFSYASPHEILAFYLMTGTEQTYRLRLRRKERAEPTGVKLAPGEKHTLEVKVLEDYALPDVDAAALEYATLYATCRLEGIHDLPQLSRYGRGVNMRNQE